MADYTDRIINHADGIGIKEALDRIADAVGAQSKNPVRYGIRIDKNDGNADSRITYIFDAVGMTPAKMDYANGRFDYGSWADAWFVKNNYPAFYSLEGKEEYKLDPNDQTKKIDGSASGIADASVKGNFFSVFDGSNGNKIYLCQEETATGYEYIIVSNYKWSDKYVDDAYVREDGSHADKLLYPMFKGSIVDGKLRSIAGQNPTGNTSAQEEINYAVANSDKAKYRIGDWAHYNLIWSLLKIMGKSDNLQSVFGNGDMSTYDKSNTTTYGKVDTGTLKDKGQFFGYNNGAHDVKCFYIEGLWADRWERLLGFIQKNGKALIKMTPPYNLTGDGYTDAGAVPSNEGWAKGSTCNRYGRWTATVGASDSTFLCDYYYVNTSVTAVLLVGGSCANGSRCGACLILNSAAGNRDWIVGASLFLEPLVGGAGA